MPARDLRDAQATLDDTRARLQEAGTAVTGRNYKEALALLNGVREKVNAAITAVDAIQRPAKKRR